MIGICTTYTTGEVADELGMSHAALGVWVSRNPQYQPAERMGRRFIWTRSEIARVRKARQVTAHKARSFGKEQKIEQEPD